MIQRTVDPGSWHFAYYCWIRQLYGQETYSSQPLSLCKYFQTMLWGSIFCIPLFLLSLIGRMTANIGRRFLRLSGPRFTRFRNYFENKFGAVEALEKAPQKFEESPLVTGFVWFIIAIMCVLVLGFLAGIAILVGSFFWNIGLIASLLLKGILYAGWALFYVFAAFGYGMHYAWFGISWFFTNGPLWIGIATWASYVICGALVTGLVAVCVCYPIMWLGKKEFFKNMTANLFKFANVSRENGDDNSEERKVKKVNWTCSYCHYKNTTHKNRKTCIECGVHHSSYLFRVINFLVDSLVVNPMGWVVDNPIRWTGQRVSGTHHQFLNGWSIVWEFIKAMKKGACPILVVATPEQVQQRAVFAAEQRMKKEAHHFENVWGYGMGRKVWDVVDEECDPAPSTYDFLDDIAYHQMPREFRFGGKLGFGGKLFSNSRNVWVDYYPEDRTPERDAIVERVNARIKELLKNEDD
jgi:hypothetical protein